MFKNIFYVSLLAAFFYTSQCVAQGSDSLRDRRIDTTRVNPVMPGLQSPVQGEGHDFNEGNSKILLPEEIPPVLRKTLQDPQYQGWESGKIYRHLATSEYKLELQKGTYAETFYFDTNGERILE
ncbi:MAG TPA: hypothetical protein VD884_06815 [Ohtaekwangia sp.]|nr:hypothetical protein [Ohtaekwangia sp.]